jgi:hypothetical protein
MFHDDVVAIATSDEGSDPRSDELTIGGVRLRR